MAGRLNGYLFASAYLLAAFSFVVCVPICTGSVTYEGAAQLEVVGEPWDLGDVAYGGTKTAVFALRNTGTAQLLIKAVNTCCGFTVQELSAWRIPPGGTSDVIVRYDAFGKAGAGQFKRGITIASNDGLNPVLKIPVSVNITGPKKNQEDI